MMKQKNIEINVFFDPKIEKRFQRKKDKLFSDQVRKEVKEDIENPNWLRQQFHPRIKFIRQVERREIYKYRYRKKPELRFLFELTADPENPILLEGNVEHHRYQAVVFEADKRENFN